jgi:hypothetical protein
LNTFEVVLHSTYLCLKVTATFSVITAFGSQKKARNIERDFAQHAFYERRYKSIRAVFSPTRNTCIIQESNQS